MSSIVDTTEIFMIVGYLIVYMYLGTNFLMMAMERKISVSLTDIRKTVYQISQMLSKEHNPKEYLQARFYFWGIVAMLIIGMALLGVSNA